MMLLSWDDDAPRPPRPRSPWVDTFLVAPMTYFSLLLSNAATWGNEQEPPDRCYVRDAERIVRAAPWYPRYLATLSPNRSHHRHITRLLGDTYDDAR
jgi:hypothetical protein